MIQLPLLRPYSDLQSMLTILLQQGEAIILFFEV